MTEARVEAFLGQSDLADRTKGDRIEGLADDRTTLELPTNRCASSQMTDKEPLPSGIFRSSLKISKIFSFFQRFRPSRVFFGIARPSHAFTSLLSALSFYFERNNHQVTCSYPVELDLF
jgi:hypothetical protein